MPISAEILGVKIQALARSQLLAELRLILNSPQRDCKIIATTYSEFLVQASRNRQFKDILNTADFNIADGIGVLWAASFLNRKTADLFEVAREFLISAWQTAFDHKKIQYVLPEKISGADLIWDILRLAEEAGNSVYFLGSYGDVVTPILNKYPLLKVAGRSQTFPHDREEMSRINSAQADILLVAFGPFAQYLWLSPNKNNLEVKLAMGVGGTFDYIMGKRPRAGEWWQNHGLEWLYRLFTQPWRWRRMWNAIIVFSWLVFKEKYKTLSK